MWPDWPSGQIGHLGRLAIPAAIGEKLYGGKANPDQPDERLCPIMSLCLGSGPTGRQRRDKTRHFWDRRRHFCDSVEKSASPGHQQRDKTRHFCEGRRHFRDSVARTRKLPRKSDVNNGT